MDNSNEYKQATPQTPTLNDLILTCFEYGCEIKFKPFGSFIEIGLIHRKTSRRIEQALTKEDFLNMEDVYLLVYRMFYKLGLYYPPHARFMHEEIIP